MVAAIPGPLRLVIRRALASVVLGYASFVGAAPAAAWPNAPLPSTPIAPLGPTSVQSGPASIPDGSGGAFVVFQDGRSGSFDVYAQHVLASGAVDPAWPATGAPVCTEIHQQSGIKLISDGAGGMYVAWIDERNGPYNDVYVQRVTGTGAIAPGWPANGLGVGTNTGIDELNPSICRDKTGGLIAVWEYTFSSSDHDVSAARVSPSGALTPWGAVYQPVTSSMNPVVAPDTTGGCYIAWSEYTNSTKVQVMAMHLDGSGNTIYPATVLAGFTPAIQYNPHIVVDGLGGAFIAWNDQQYGDYDVLLTRVGPSYAPQQPFYGNGVYAVRAPGTDQLLGDLQYDGAYGALVTWEDHASSNWQVYAQRVLASASIAPGWPLNGVALGATGLFQQAPIAVPDGTGGGLFTWMDTRGSPFIGSLYATRLGPNGTRAPHWNGTGNIAVSTYLGSPTYCACPDGRRGAIMSLSDFRSTQQQTLIFCNRIDRYGVLGDAQPSMASIKDVPADQGGKLKLTWNASYLDSDPIFTIGSYWIWRATSPSVAAQAVSAGARWVEGDPTAAAALVTSHATDGTSGSDGGRDGASGSAHPQRWFRHDANVAAPIAWEFVASQPANGSTQYSFVSPTISDSVAGYNPRTTFLVEARDADNVGFWDSAPDSGYSVDNLAPTSPASFTGAYSAGATHLHWPRNGESDLAGYRIYRGSSAAFVPGPGNVISAQPDTGYGDAGPAGRYYKLSAVDAHGNESSYALLTPSGTTDAGATPSPAALWLGPMTPNPARVGAEMRFALPRAARAELSVYDAQGRLVRSLLNGSLEAGDHAVRWDGLDAGGRRLANGVYMTRLTVEGEIQRGRFVVVN